MLDEREIVPVSWNSRTKNIASVQFSSVQSLSCVWLFVTPWIEAR